MRKSISVLRFAAIMSAPLFVAGCGRQPATVASAPARHEHHTPHGGTPVVLGEEAYHLELVLDATTGKLQVFILDGEMENFVRSAASSFEIAAAVNGEKRTLLFAAVADPATGEKVGDTALFETQADWLKTVATFDGVLISLTIQGTTFTAIPFNFPRGNDTDGDK